MAFKHRYNANSLLNTSAKYKLSSSAWLLSSATGFLPKALPCTKNILLGAQ